MGFLVVKHYLRGVSLTDRTPHEYHGWYEWVFVSLRVFSPDLCDFFPFKGGFSLAVHVVEAPPAAPQCELIEWLLCLIADQSQKRVAPGLRTLLLGLGPCL